MFLPKNLFIFILSSIILLSLAKSDVSAATLSLSPNSGLVCGTFDINVFVNPEGKNVAGVDVYLNYETSKLDFSQGNILTSGSVFNNFPLTSVNSSNGKIIIGAAASAGAPITGTTNQKVVTLRFQTKITTGTTTLTFDYSGGTASDSNVSEDVTGAELLTSAPANGSYSSAAFGNGTGSNCSTQQGGPAATATPRPTTPPVSKGGLPQAGFPLPMVIMIGVGFFLTLLGLRVIPL